MNACARMKKADFYVEHCTINKHTKTMYSACIYSYKNISIYEVPKI